jgi:hypothetical protein
VPGACKTSAETGNWQTFHNPDYSRRRPMSQEKLYTIISNRTASSSTKNPAVTWRVLSRKIKRNWKYENQRAVGTYVRTAVAVETTLICPFSFARAGLYKADGPLPIKKARVAFENWLNLLHRAPRDFVLIGRHALMTSESIVKGREGKNCWAVPTQQVRMEEGGRIHVRLQESSYCSGWWNIRNE